MAGFKPGDLGHLAEHDRIAGELAGRLSEGELSATFAAQFTATESTTADDISAWLAIPTDGPKRLVGAATITEPIIIPSDTHLDASGAVITLADGSDCNILNNASVTPLRTGSADASVTAAGATITSASAAFTTADIGRQVAVLSTSTDDGMNAYGTIIAVASGVATITGTIRKTQTGGTVYVYGRDSNIIIDGGIWNRGTNAGLLWNLHSFRLRRIDGLTVRNARFESLSGKYALSLGDVNRYDIGNLDFDTASDGVHIQGPAHSGSIANLRGRTGDDLLGITPMDYFTYDDVFGDVTGLRVDGLFPDGALAAFKLGSGDGCAARSIRVRNIYGSCETRPVSIQGDGIGTSVVDNILIDGVDCEVTGTTDMTVLFGSTSGSPLNAGRIELRNIRSSRTSSTRGGIISVLNGNFGTTIDHLIVDGVSHDPATPDTTYTSVVYVEGIVRKLDVHNAELSTPATNVTGAAIVTNWTNGTIDNLTMVNCHVPLAVTSMLDNRGILGKASLRGLRAGVSVVQNLGTMNEVTLADVQCALGGTSGTLVQTKSNTRIVLGEGVVHAGTGNAFNFNQAGITVTMYGKHIITGTGGGFARTDGSVLIKTRDIQLPIRADWVVKEAGALCYNNLVGLASGVGPHACDGTTWRNLATNATWTP